ncbi:MAG: MerR family transcriptional regulator, light-induced transcriptional regulator [Solirubrobacteraceae bacterium]|jgi:DNA-binding transcriptional MerR regulator|nr:MerR family transcriptional regulator, light-induced transcriptional regulator [Solirubrobacteraceae bacterium]
MNGIRTNAAAVMLGISPNTLRSWERRYSFPQPLRSAGGHRQYSLTEIEALRLTLAETHNVSSAISLARERGEGPSTSSRLAAAFASFDEEAANRLLEESLGLRSVERTIEEVLLDAVTAQREPDISTAEYEFGWRHAMGWLSAQRRLAPPANRPEGVMIFDASAPCDLDALHAQALEVVLRRSGVRTLSLTPAIDLTRLGRALRALEPRAVVLTGRRVSLDSIGRLVYAVRSVAREVAVFDYRGAVPDTGASTVHRLGDSPLAARDGLLARLAPDQADAGMRLTAIAASHRSA